MLSRAILLFLLLAPWATVAVAAQAETDPVIAGFVADSQFLVGRQGATIRYVDVRGEGRTLIIEIEMLPGPIPRGGNQRVADIVSAGLCSRPTAVNLFRDGRTLRVQVSQAGRSLGAVTVDHCPGPIGEGISAGTFASGMQTFVGRLYDGMRVTSVAAEGNAVVVTLEAEAGTDAVAVERAWVRGLCGGGPGGLAVLFNNGLAVRIDVMIGGRNLVRGTPLTGCPSG